MLKKPAAAAKGAQETELPVVIGIRTEEFAPLLLKWRRRNRGVPWSDLLRRSLRGFPELRALATKTDAHLLN